MRKLAFVAAAVAVVSVSAWLFAARPHDPDLVLPYRGYLEQSGHPINSAIDVTVTLYNASTGEQKWSDDFRNVQVAAGQLVLMLGSQKALDPALFADSVPVDLEITLNTDGGTTTLTPRQRMHPVPYAVSAGNAHHASGEFDVDGGVNATAVSATTLSGGSATLTGSVSANGVTTPSVTGTGGTNVTVSPGLTVQGPAQVNGTASAQKFAAQYDSGWFAVSNSSGDYVLTHNLGQVPSQVTLLQCGVISSYFLGGFNKFTSTCDTPVVVTHGVGYHDSGTQVNPLATLWNGSTATITFLSDWWVWNYWNNAKGWSCQYPSGIPFTPNCFNGFYRLLAWR
jgi:hypothetical protein